MLNLSSLFYTTIDANPSFLAELELLSHEKDYINQCKNDIRSTLRSGLKENLSLVLRNHGIDALEITPRFFIQGSWAYKTLNRPHTAPPQQSDLDDGVYLPMSIVKQSEKPSIASELFFEAAERALMPLTEERRWVMVQKPTCIRVEVSACAHIDIPLYAIPDADFARLRATMDAKGYFSINEAISASDDSWTTLPSDHVLLAHRDENWIKSDPRAMRDWFLQAVDDYGEQLRRVVRYIKAFRDKAWPTGGGPSSILLMAAAVSVFVQRKRRDDKALADVVMQIPNLLREGVLSPIDSGIFLTDSLGLDGVEDAASKFEEFSQYLNAALCCKDRETACNWVRKMLGERFPNRADLVIALSVSETVKATPAEPGPNELVKNTKAG